MLNRKQFFLVSVGAALAGCGGGAEEQPDPNAPFTPRVRVKWPALSRAFEGTSYAMSARITLFDASLNTTNPNPEVPLNKNVIIIGNRTRETAYEAVYAATEPILPGTVRVRVEFFADPYTRGRQLLVAIQEVEPDVKGFLPDFTLGNGTGALTAITLSLANDVVTPVKVGQSFEVKVSTNFNPEEMNWEVTSSEPEQGPMLEKAPYTTFNVQRPSFKALRPGTATITLTVHGVTSNPLTVTVEPA